MDKYQNILAVYRANGDTRETSVILAEIKVDEQVLNPPAKSNEVVGVRRVVLSDGTVEEAEILGDGTERAKQ